MREAPHTHGGSDSDGKNFDLVVYDYPDIDHPEWFTATVRKVVRKYMDEALKIYPSYPQERITVEFARSSTATVEDFYAYPDGNTGGRVSIKHQKTELGEHTKTVFNLETDGIDRSEEIIQPE